MSAVPTDYTVLIEVSVTATSPEQAARHAIDDLRDPSIGPWNVSVRAAKGTLSCELKVS